MPYGIKAEIERKIGKEKIRILYGRIKETTISFAIVFLE